MRRILTILFLLVLILLIPVITLIFASRDAKFGEGLYPIKQKTEELSLRYTDFNPYFKFALLQYFSNKRLDETVFFINNKQDAQALYSLNKLVDELGNALLQLQLIADENQQLQLAQKFNTSLDKYQLTLSKIKDQKVQLVKVASKDATPSAVLKENANNLTQTISKVLDSLNLLQLKTKTILAKNNNFFEENDLDMIMNDLDTVNVNGLNDVINSTNATLLDLAEAKGYQSTLLACSANQPKIKNTLFNTLTLSQSMIDKLDSALKKVTNHYLIVTLSLKQSYPHYQTSQNEIIVSRKRIENFLSTEIFKIPNIQCIDVIPLLSFSDENNKLLELSNLISSHKAKIVNLIAAIIATDKGLTYTDEIATESATVRPLDISTQSASIKPSPTPSKSTKPTPKPK